MWKKEDEQPQRPVTTSAPRPEAPASAPRRSGQAVIGPSIVIRGEVSGDEDLVIQGQVDGSVTLDLHSVTVGDSGRVKAGIKGRVITIEGNVEGDLTAQEQIVLRGTARVQGDLKAPRVVLEDGATFRGLVDMGVAMDQGRGSSASDAAAKKAETKSDGSSTSTPGTRLPEAEPPSGRKGPAPSQEKSATSRAG